MIRPTRVVPPVYFALALLAMAALHRWLPLVRWIVWPWRWLGVLLVLGGLSMVLACAGALRRAQTTILPFERPSTLVTRGLFRICRNPIYLGMATALTGTAVLLGSLSPWSTLPVFVVIIDRRFIRHEEAMLHARFGQAYEGYCQHVRRWL